MNLPGVNISQFRRLIELTLKEIGLYSIDAVDLLLRTAAHESGMGSYIKQVGGGPALGVFQMEPNTFFDHINWLNSGHKDLLNAVLTSCGISSVFSAVDISELKSNKSIAKDLRERIPNSLTSVLYPEMLMYNIKFAICMARIHYLRTPGVIPSTLDGQWSLYKKYYNTIRGSATEDQFKSASKRYGI